MMTEQEIPQKGTPEYAKAVAYEADRLDFFDDAKALRESRLWSPPPRPLSLYEQLEEDVPESDYIFDGFWSGNLQLNAQKKAGKTTVMMNAAGSLVTQKPFLGRFAVNTEPDCRVAFLNMELPQSQFNLWFQEMGLSAEARKRIVPYHARRYGSLDFSKPPVIDWLANWFRDEGVSIAFLDPLSSVYDASRWGSRDPNASFLRWWSVFEQLVLDAGLRGVWIGHHSGLSEEAGNRGRGASAMGDKPDMSMTLRYEPGGDGHYTDAPADTKRYISVYGRDVDVNEFEIEYDSGTRLYAATGGGSRVQQSGESWALKIHDALVARRKRGEPPDLNADEMMAELGISPTSRQSADVRRGRRIAVERGWLVQQNQGKAKLFRLGSVTPISRGGGGFQTTKPTSQAGRSTGVD
jgi:hypothetical protein